MIRYFLLLPGYLMASAVLAQTVDHAYTDLDLEADCQWAEMGDEEAAMGGSAVCQGYGDYPVHVAEGDLRMFVAFGPTAEPFRFWQSFIKAPFPVQYLRQNEEGGKPRW